MGQRVSFATLAADKRDIADTGDLPACRVPVDELAGNPDNPRGPDDPAVVELAATMRDHGQLQPLVVISRAVFLAHFPEHADAVASANWIVINGNRRLAAARHAGLETIDVVVRDDLGDGEGRIDDAVMIENIHRENLDPLREAEFLRRMVDRPGSSLRKVAAKIGKTHVYVQQRLTLLKLTPELQEALRAGTLTIKQARTIATLAPAEQLAAWRAMTAPPEPPDDDAAVEPKAAVAAPAATSKTGNGTRAAAPRIALTSPQETVAALRAHFSAEQLAELVSLLMSPALDTP